MKGEIADARFDVHIYHHIDSGSADQKLDRILAQLGVIARQEIHTMEALDTLTDQVKANTDTEASAIVVLNGIADRIAAAGTDPVKLNALTSDLSASAAALAAAIVANSPTPPAPAQV